MSDIIKQNGYTFKTIKSNNPYRPFKVKCMETLEEKESALSYNDAISLLLTPLLATQAQIELDSQSEDYVKKVFSILIGKKISQCDELVENEIVNRGLIKGRIFSIKEKERFQDYKEYKTEIFLVTVRFENGIMRTCTKIEIEKI